ncbi:hypothetical protein SprV_0301110800 [Sparganum proliferum]
MSTINQIRSAVRESGPSASEDEDDLDSDLQILEPPTLLTREEMEALLHPMRKKLGVDHEVGLLITNALNHDEDSMQKLCKFVPDGRLRESFLATIVSVEWVFYFLAAVNGSARTLMGLLDTLADKSEGNRTNAQAVVKLLTGQLGEGPYLKPFYNAFMQCRAAVMNFCVKRGANQAEAEASFRECLCEMDDEYKTFGDLVGLQIEEVQQLTQLTKNCQMDALTQYLSALPGRDRGGDMSALMAQEKRIANMDPDAVGFSGPETANEDEIRVYKNFESSSPGQSTIFTDGAGLELPEFIDEQSEESFNQQDTISEARTDHSPLADIHMEAPPLMVDDEPTDTKPRTPILKGKTPMRFQRGGKTRKQGGSPAVFPSSDAHTEVGRASAINDIKVEEGAEPEPHEMFKLEVQPEATVDELMAPEEGERVVSGASGLDKTVRTDAAKRGHATAADSGREPTKRQRRKEDDRSEQGATKERDLEGSEHTGSRKHKHVSHEEAAKQDEVSLDELLNVAAGETSPEIVSKAMEKLLSIVGKGRVSTDVVLQLLEKLSGIYKKRTSDFQAMEIDHTDREPTQRILEILKTTLEQLGLPAEDEEIPENTLGKTPEELAEMSPEEVEELKNKVKADRMRAKVEEAMAARAKAAMERRQRERASSSSSSSSYSSTATSRSDASSKDRDSGAEFKVRDGRPRRKRRGRVSSTSSSSDDAYLDKMNEGLAADVHSRRLAREARERDRSGQYYGSDEDSYDDEYSEDDDDVGQGRSRRRRHRHGRREDEDYDDDEEDEDQGRGRHHRRHRHRRREDDEGGEEEEGYDDRRRHHRRGGRRRWSDEDEYDDHDDREEDGGRHRRGRRRRRGRSDDDDSMEERGRGRRKQRPGEDEDGSYYYDLDASGKKGKRRKQEGLQYDRYEHAVQERQVGVRRGRRSSQFFHDYDDEGGVIGYRHGLHHRAQSAGGYYPSGFGPRAAAPRTVTNQPQALPAVQVRLWQPLVRTLGRTPKVGKDVVEKVVMSAESEEEPTPAASAKKKDDRGKIFIRDSSVDESKQVTSMERKVVNEESVMKDEQVDDGEMVENAVTRAHSDVQEVSIGKIAFSKFRAEKLIPANKLVHAIKRKAKEVAFISPEMLERRQKTRKLLEKMQHQLGMASGEEGSAMHPLTIDQIKEALQNPEFAEIAKEFQQLQGTLV